MSHNQITSSAEAPLLRRDVNAQATREEILRVARSAFAARGYSEVKLEDVARAAKATTGAIYHHFKGKNGLMLAVGEHVEREVIQLIGARISTDAEPWDAIRAAAVATLEICSRPDISRIIFKEAPNALGAAVWREVEMRYGLGGLQALFQRACDAGTLAPADAPLVTRVFMAALIEAVEAVVEAECQTGMDDARAALDRLIDAFRTGNARAGERTP